MSWSPPEPGDFIINWSPRATWRYELAIVTDDGVQGFATGDDGMDADSSWAPWPRCSWTDIAYAGTPLHDAVGVAYACAQLTDNPLPANLIRRIEELLP